MNEPVISRPPPVRKSLPPEKGAASSKTGPVAKPASAPKEPAKAPSQPLAVVADRIRVRAINDGDAREVAEIWTEGNIHVTQNRQTGKAPLDIRGDKLHLQNFAEEKHILRVQGTDQRPGKVRDGEMNLEGPDINLDRGENFVHVIGPGLLQLPVNNALDGKPLDKPQKLDVRWKEQMQFNGETAKFFADVVARHDQGNMLCQEMHVTLSNRVSFSERNPEGQKTEVRYVVCKEFVQLENYEYQLGQLVGIQRAAVQEATLVQATGETTAQGPGTLIAWRKGDGKSPGLAPRAGVQANRALQTSTLEWDYTQVKFSGTMQGNTRERHTTFRDRVHVLHGPVKQSTDAVDIDNLPVEGGWLEGDELRITQHPETRGTPAYLDMLAIGNVKLGGRSTQGDFTALADNVSFDESKGLYILKSLGNREATVWRQTRADRPPQATRGASLRFNPTTKELSIDKASSISGLE